MGLKLPSWSGANRHEPLSSAWHKDQVTFSLDLNEVKKLASELDKEAELPDTLVGVVSTSLIVHGEKDVSWQFAINEAVHVEGTFAGEGHIKFTSAARDPLLSARWLGPDKPETYALDIGPTTWVAPWQTIDDESMATGTGEIYLAGLSMILSYVAETDTLSIDNLGIGDATSTIKLDGTTLLAVGF